MDVEPQTLMNLVAGGAAALISLVVKMLHGRISRIEENHDRLRREHAGMRELVASDYVKSERFDTTTARIFEKLDRIEDKIDRKADK